MTHRQTLPLALALIVSVITVITTVHSDETPAGVRVENEVARMNGETSNMNEDAHIEPATWMTYVNSNYVFRLNYPDSFVRKTRDVSKLTDFTPVPVASIFFMNPTMARGSLAGIESPDLEVRVYLTGNAVSLKNWLVAVGFASADNGTISRPYRNFDINGLEVCQSSMIAPGCSIYVLGDTYVYQLTAMSHKGEKMITTFQIGE